VELRLPLTVVNDRIEIEEELRW
jgi:hypothetical protein